MNQNIKKILDAIELLRSTTIDCSLEISSLSHKMKTLYEEKINENTEGIEFMVQLEDDELLAAIANRDKRTNLYPFVDPAAMVYIKNQRTEVFMRMRELKL
mgnify:CR=1 FL=1